jgi:hypothetical protein
VLFTLLSGCDSDVPSSALLSDGIIRYSLSAAALTELMLSKPNALFLSALPNADVYAFIFSPPVTFAAAIIAKHNTAVTVRRKNDDEKFDFSSGFRFKSLFVGIFFTSY